MHKTPGLIVLTPVRFHDQAPLKAGEVDNINSQTMLTPEMEAKRIAAQSAPEPPLGVGHAFPEMARA